MEQYNVHFFSKWHKSSAKNKNILNDDDFYPISMDCKIIINNNNITVYNSDDEFINKGIKHLSLPHAYDMVSLAGSILSINEQHVSWTTFGAGFPHVWSIRGIIKNMS